VENNERNEFEKVGNDNIPVKIRVLLADDHAVLRESLRHFLEEESEFEVVAEASNGEDAVNLTVELNPDIIIMDISMPGLNGIEATRQIKSRCPRVAILALTVHNDNEYVYGIMKAGATGYLVKTVSASEVIHAIRLLIAGETVLSPSVSQQIFKDQLAQDDRNLNTSVTETLTARELEMLRLVAKGTSNKDIALKLGLSLNSVKSYLTTIFLKLNVRSRTEAVVISFSRGILTEDDLKKKSDPR
jgi:two-component system, NarL family, response regulator LiaR